MASNFLDVHSAFGCNGAWSDGRCTRKKVLHGHLYIRLAQTAGPPLLLCAPPMPCTCNGSSWCLIYLHPPEELQMLMLGVFTRVTIEAEVTRTGGLPGTAARGGRGLNDMSNRVWSSGPWDVKKPSLAPLHDTLVMNNNPNTFRACQNTRIHPVDKVGWTHITCLNAGAYPVYKKKIIVIHLYIRANSEAYKIKL